MQSDTVRHMVRIQQILDTISKSNGYLVKYQVTGNRTEWEAFVPQGLVKIAIENTQYKDVSTGRLRIHKAEIAGLEGELVRIRGKR